MNYNKEEIIEFIKVQTALAKKAKDLSETFHILSIIYSYLNSVFEFIITNEFSPTHEFLNVTLNKAKELQTNCFTHVASQERDTLVLHLDQFINKMNTLSLSG